MTNKLHTPAKANAPTWKIAAVGLFMAPSMAVSAQDMEAGGEVRLELAAEEGSITKNRIEALPELEVNYESGTRFVGSARLRIDASDKLLPGKPDYDSYCGICRPLNIGSPATLELRDFYLEADKAGVLWRVGKQQVVWGQLDGYKLLDQVNPQSFEEFILEDFDRSRIGLWSVSAETSFGETDVQFVYAPDTSVSYIPDSDALFAFQAPRFRFGQTGGAGDVQQVTDKPGNVFADGTYAVRASRYVAGWDLAVVAITGLDHTPVGAFVLHDGQPALERSYRHRSLVGASAATSFGSFVLRSEFGFYPNRAFNTSVAPAALSVVERDQLTLAAALDYDGPGGLFLSAQIIYDTVFDAPEALTRPADDVLYSVFARKYFNNETIKAEARLYGANGLFEDGLLRTSLTYVASDNLELTAGFDLFFGDRQGIYGQFGERDRITFTAKRYF